MQQENNMIHIGPGPMELIKMTNGQGRSGLNPEVVLILKQYGTCL